MTSFQPYNFRGLLPSLHLAHGTQANVLTQRGVDLDDIPGPQDRPDEEGCHQRGDEERLLERKYSSHEYQEHDDSPNQSCEGYGPGLALRFIRLVEHWREDSAGDFANEVMATNQKGACTCKPRRQPQSRWLRI